MTMGLGTNKAKPVTLEVWHRRLGHRSLDQTTIQFLQPLINRFLIESSVCYRAPEAFKKAGPPAKFTAPPQLNRPGHRVFFQGSLPLPPAPPVALTGSR